MTGALRELLFAEPGSLEVSTGRGVVPLAVTSARSGVLARQSFADATPEALASEFVAGDGSRVLAAYASGARSRARSPAPRERTPRASSWSRMWTGSSIRSRSRSRMRRGGPLTRPINDNRAFSRQHDRVRQRCGTARPDPVAGPDSASLHANRTAPSRERNGWARRAVGTRPPDIGRRAAHREADHCVRDRFAATASRRSRGDGDRDSPQTSPIASSPARDPRPGPRRGRETAGAGDCRQLRRTRPCSSRFSPASSDGAVGKFRAVAGNQ